MWYTSIRSILMVGVAALTFVGPAAAQPQARTTAKIEIVNPTDGPLKYRINGGAIQEIGPGEQTTWELAGTSSEPPVFLVEFNNGRGRVAEYRLLGGSVYEFGWVRKRLDLFRR
jgi:hypothetical protein